MTTAYLIMAHQQPKLLHRLISRLPASAPVFLHLSAQVSLSDFECIRQDFSGRVHFISRRVQGGWGRFSLVQATLNLLQAAGNNFDYYVLLSGQDYPLATADALQHFFEAHNGKSFIEHHPLPDPRIRDRQDGLYRINRYHYFSGGEHREFPPYSRKKLLHPFFNQLAHWYSRYLRPIPLNMQPYWGSQWWMLHNRAVQHLNHLLKDPAVVRFFRNTWLPDEMFFQTLLLHGDAALRQTLVNHNYRMIKWPDETDSLGFVLHPSVFSAADFTLLQQADALFARKFSEQKSEALLNRVDEQLLGIRP